LSRVTTTQPSKARTALTPTTSSVTGSVEIDPVLASVAISAAREAALITPCWV